jgi:hypothetical protein
MPTVRQLTRRVAGCRIKICANASRRAKDAQAAHLRGKNFRNFFGAALALIYVGSGGPSLSEPDLLVAKAMP